jgi:predicted nucleic acid-binding protein
MDVAGIDTKTTILFPRALHRRLVRLAEQRRTADGRKVYDLARIIVPNVLPVTVEVMDEAWRILEAHGKASARDAVHAAALRHCGGEAICSYDADFDAIAGVVRQTPDRIVGLG